VSTFKPPVSEYVRKGCHMFHLAYDQRSEFQKKDKDGYGVSGTLVI
jgi:hypothetical protein